jgi:hypothetical protein
MAANYSYTWAQGEDLVLAMLYKIGLPDQEPQPVDLTTYSLRMDIVTPTGQKRYTFNSDAIVGDSVTEAVLGADGLISITIPRTLTLEGGAIFKDITATPPMLTFNYDVFLRDAAGLQRKILEGQINVERSHTLWP